jgi:NAD(P)-dependent dehydrogenase (short-subunit alcohol dehydrogenase family)
VWDVALHVDAGRDTFLYTPGHMAIVTGLGLILAAGALSIMLATNDESETGLRFRHLRVPRGAVALVVLGAGALVGFPLDEFWHRAYGIDVTMWGPTHLIMITGASLSPIALWLLLTEAGSRAGRPGLVRGMRVLLVGALLTGLSTFQLEFDLGVPQFQHLYHPVLIALAASVGLVAARTILGRGGALVAVGGFLAIRGGLALLTGGVLNLTVPRFPLYVGAALSVELAFWLGRRLRPAALALAAGAAVGTAGLAAEWGWMQVWGRHPWGESLVPSALTAVAIAVPGALIGIALGRVASFRAAGIPGPAVLAAGLAIVALLGVPLQRNADPIRAEVVTRPAGTGLVDVEVTLNPADEGYGADWFEVLSWQGGRARVSHMVPLSDGRFAAERPVPVGAPWKSVIRLAHHDLVMAVPVYMPADPELGLSEIPVAPRRVSTIQRDTDMLMREAHGGPILPALVAYGFILAIAVVWVTVLARGYAAVSRRGPGNGGPLSGRRIVVTGARGGIGTAAVKALRAEGARVVGIDLRPGLEVVAGDVTDVSSMEAALAEAARRLGGIDTLVNNAGIGRAQDSGAAPDRGSRATLEVNLLGTWITTAAARPHLLAERGHVVNVASGLAIVNLPYSAAYAASKRGVHAYSDVLRLEYAGRLTVTTVDPGYVRTAIHDRTAEAGVSIDGLVWSDSVDQAAAAIVRACTDRPRGVSTSARTGLGLALARHFPRATDAVVGWRFRRAGRTLAPVTAPHPPALRPREVPVGG